MGYDIRRVFFDYFRERTISEEELKELVSIAKEFVDWVKPDFYLIGGPAVPGLVFYEENINFNFRGRTPGSLTLINNIVDDQVEALQEIDALTLKYAMTNPMEPKEFIFCLWFNVSFGSGDIRTIHRKVVILKVDDEKHPDLAILSISDVTKVHPEKKIGFEVRSSALREDKEEVHWVKELTEKVEEILCSHSMYLTNREMQILTQIDQGLSSSDIAEKLFISKATVDTHRQNMIKKFKVPNTTALLFVARQKGILKN